MKIKDHRLEGEGIDYIESPNQGGPFAEGRLDTIVIHYTDGGSVEGAIQTLCDPERKVSAHLVVGREGSIVQLLPFDTIGWHAGQSAWRGREGFNNFSIGIEIDNAGRLEKKGDKYISWFGQEYPEQEVVQVVRFPQEGPTFWHCFTEGQLEVVEQLCQLLIEEYNIHYILGHEEIAPGRKIDPGPAFPLNVLRKRLLPFSREW
jgi:N-acetylmuramoyl-L-alanine amidase